MRLGIQERAVQRRIARLVELGYVRRIRQIDDAGTDLANGYDLQPLWQRIDDLDAQTTGERVSCVTPLINRDLRDLDPREDPPTPIDTVEYDLVEEVGTPELIAGSDCTGTTHAADTYAAPHDPAAGHDAARSALAAAMQPILIAYHEAYPAAAVGQFLGLQQRYVLDLPPFVAALERAKARVDERIADADELAPIKRPVAYLYAVLAKDLAEQTAPPASSPAEPSGEAQLRVAAARLAVELGTSQPSSAASRIMRLFRRSGLPAAAFCSRMHEAVRQLRQCAIKVSGKDGEPNALPLFLTILQRLLAGRPQPGGWPERRSREIGGAATRPQQQSAPEIS